MATTTRIYRWDDTSAPTLTGQAGSLKDLLKLVLYGNGSGVAYGSGGSQKLAAGWSLPFSDTSTKLVVRNSLAAGGTGMYFRLLDDASGTGGAREAFGISYSAMTDIDTGSDATPTSAQMTKGAVFRKSSTADGTARKWIVVADERTFYIWIEALAGDVQDFMVGGAGDFSSFLASDGYPFFCSGNNTQNTAGTSGIIAFASSALAAGTAGLWVARSYAGTGTAVGASILVPQVYAANAAGAIGGALFTQTDPGPAGLRFYAPGLIAHNAGIRGQLRGLYAPLHLMTSVAAGTTDSGAVGAGSTLVIVSAAGVNNNANYRGRLAIETALEWAA